MKQSNKINRFSRLKNIYFRASKLVFFFAAVDAHDVFAVVYSLSDVVHHIL